MRVLVVEPGILPYEKEINGLKEMQEVVGGPITALYPWEDQAAIVCNDEALLLKLPFNRSVEGGLWRCVRSLFCLWTGGGGLLFPHPRTGENL